MEKRNAPQHARLRRGLMDTLLRRRDPAGDALFDPDEETEGEEELAFDRHE